MLNLGPTLVACPAHFFVFLSFGCSNDMSHANRPSVEGLLNRLIVLATCSPETPKSSLYYNLPRVTSPLLQNVAIQI